MQQTSGSQPSMVENLAFGLSTPLRAAKLIFTRPSLFLLALLPVSITLFLYSQVGLYVSETLKHAILAFFLAHGLDASGFGASLVIGLLQLLITLTLLLAFSFGANMVSVPFNDFLAERAERFTKPELPKVPWPGLTIQARLLLIDLFKSVVSIAMTLLTLLLSWVPLLNLVALVLTALTVTFQFLSYPQTRRGEGIGAAVSFIGRNFFLSLGFGASMGLLLMIPWLGSLLLPLAVVGGTIVYARAKQA